MQVTSNQGYCAKAASKATSILGLIKRRFVKIEKGVFTTVVQRLRSA